MTDVCDPNNLQNHLRSFIFDEKHMTSRGLKFLHERTGLDQFFLAVFIISSISVYLMIGHEARIVANAILTITPILLTYVFPEERPPTPQLLIYWSAFGLLTIFDSNFKSESCYYFVKVILLALLFLHPFDGADRILEHIRQIRDENVFGSVTRDQPAELVAPSDMLLEGPPSREDYYSSLDNENKNPMLFHSGFQIKPYDLTSAESLSINYNPHDLTFEPTKYLVFNAPYDFENLTYIIRICNTSTKYIAFAIKTNAIPRISATPPCGVLPPKQKCNIAVIMKKIDKFTHKLASNDRLAFDYVFCPPETKRFKFKLLQSEMRRRKNIYIKYNT